MSKPDLWMPFFIADYLADTTHLSTEEHGAYMLLLMAAWMRGGELASDDGQLMRICRADKSAWKRLKPAVMEFFDIEDGVIIQRRLVEEYVKAVRVNDAQKTNGKKGGRPRKNRNPNETQDETQQKPMGFDSDNPKHNPNETPPPPPPQLKPSGIDTHLGDLPASDGVCVKPATAGAVCKAIKQQGITDVNPANPTLLALIGAGATVDEFTYAARKAMPANPHFAYVVGIVKNQRERAANLKLHKGPMPKRDRDIANTNKQAIQSFLGEGEPNVING